MKTIQWLRRPNTAGWIAAVVLAAAGSSALLLWPDHAATAVAETPVVRLVSPADKPDGPLEITDVETTVLWSEQGTSVTIQVTNRSDEPVDATIWWLLASPDEQQPWENPKAEGEHTAVRVAPSATKKVTVPVRTAPPPGSYTLSLWAHHAVSGGKTRHSHGVNAASLIQVLPLNPDVTRLSEPGRYATLTVVEPVGRLLTADRHGNGPDALVSMRSTSQQPVEVQFNCYLARIRDSRASTEPWKDHDALVSDVQHVLLSDSVPQVRPCRFAQLPRDGEWELSAFLRRSGNTEAVGHEDGLYSRATLTFGRHPRTPLDNMNGPIRTSADRDRTIS